MGLSAAVLLSALGTAGLAATSATPAWFLLLFEVALIAAGVVGVLMARGWFAGGEALGPACLGACVIVGSLLGATGSSYEVHGMNLKWWLVARFALGAGLIALGAGVALVRRPGWSVPRLLKGGIALAVTAGVVQGGRVLLTSAWWETLAGSVKLGLAVVGFGVALGAFAAGVHWVVSAFAEEGVVVGVEEKKI